MDTINQNTLATTETDYWVEQADALERLYKNKDFQKVILEGYFKDKAISGTSILALDQIKQSGRRADVMEGLVAISALQDHFNVIMTLGRVTEEDEIEDDNQESVSAVTSSEIVGE